LTTIPNIAQKITHEIEFVYLQSAKVEHSNPFTNSAKQNAPGMIALILTVNSMGGAEVSFR
jgi:hypothetical protein